MTFFWFFLWSLLKVVVVTVIFLMGVAYTVLLERKLVGRIQNRWGPSRVGPFGLLQPLVDGAKSFLKEDLIPTSVYKPALPAGSHHLSGLRAHLHRRRSLRRSQYQLQRLPLL